MLLTRGVVEVVVMIYLQVADGDIIMTADTDLFPTHEAFLLPLGNTRDGTKKPWKDIKLPHTQPHKQKLIK